MHCVFLLSLRRSSDLLRFPAPMEERQNRVEHSDLSRNRNQLEAQCKNGAALATAVNIDGSAMQSHNLRHNGQAEPSPLGTLFFAAPKAFKYPLLIWSGNSRPLIHHPHASIEISSHDHFSPGRRMNHRVLNDVPDCVLDGVSIPFDDDGS